MLGARNLRDTIEKSFDKIHDDLGLKIDKSNSDRIHAAEASTCTRLAYYDRRDPLKPTGEQKNLAMLSNGFRHALGNLHSEYKVDALSIEANADIIIADEFVVRFEVVSELPEVPKPRHMLYLNACLFAFKKDEGFLIYVNGDGKSVEFSLSKNNRMFEEIVRRARVLSTLLKEGKTPIVEPSELCQRCRYYERCYAVREKEEKGGDLIAELFGKSKKN
jgi:CRISPR-associated exonuclease Cas4